jgi:hypothetical protein
VFRQRKKNGQTKSAALCSRASEVNCQIWPAASSDFKKVSVNKEPSKKGETGNEEDAADADDAVESATGDAADCNTTRDDSGAGSAECDDDEGGVSLLPLGDATSARPPSPLCEAAMTRRAAPTTQMTATRFREDISNVGWCGKLSKSEQQSVERTLFDDNVQKERQQYKCYKQPPHLLSYCLGRGV